MSIFQNLYSESKSACKTLLGIHLLSDKPLEIYFCLWYKRLVGSNHYIAANYLTIVNLPNWELVDCISYGQPRGKQKQGQSLTAGERGSDHNPDQVC